MAPSAMQNVSWQDAQHLTQKKEILKWGGGGEGVVAGGGWAAEGP